MYSFYYNSHMAVMNKKVQVRLDTPISFGIQKHAILNL